MSPSKCCKRLSATELLQLKAQVQREDTFNYRPQTKYIFRSVCHSVHRGGGLPPSGGGLHPGGLPEGGGGLDRPPGSAYRGRSASGGGGSAFVCLFIC